MELKHVTPIQFAKYGHDKKWRLNNLYYIVNEAGDVLRFKMRWAQSQLFKLMWFCNIILKARQLGFTTFIDLFALDECLFVNNFEAAIIAHKKDDAEKIFRRKIKFPYDHLPEWLKEKRKLLSDSKSQIEFSNGSVISVSTSIRSGTVQLLHISEHGKICRKFPDKAEELKTGSLNAIHAGQLVFIESTAEGRDGDFFNMCTTAENMQIEGKKLTKLDYRFHFFPWYEHPEYDLSDEDTAEVVITERFEKYFRELEAEVGIKLMPGQKAWYIKKEAVMKDKMKQEFPSTPKEAFEQSVEGAYYATQFKKIREEGRILRIPVDEVTPVQVSWDLGISDYMCLWFYQIIGREVRWLDYYENEGEGLPFYFRILEEKARKRGWFYGIQHLPHDAGVRELRDGKSREEKFTSAGFKVEIAPRLDVLDGIDEVRKMLNFSWFDEVYCEDGIKRLENYRKAWDEKQGCFKDKPQHDLNSHGADSIRTAALNFKFSTPKKQGKKRRRRSGMAV